MLSVAIFLVISGLRLVLVNDDFSGSAVSYYGSLNACAVNYGAAYYSLLAAYYKKDEAGELFDENDNLNG